MFPCSSEINVIQKIDKQSALPNRTCTLNAEPEDNWSITSLDYLMFENLPSLSEFILLGIHKNVLQLTR